MKGKTFKDYEALRSRVSQDRQALISEGKKLRALFSPPKPSFAPLAQLGGMGRGVARLFARKGTDTERPQSRAWILAGAALGGIVLRRLKGGAHSSKSEDPPWLAEALALDQHMYELHELRQTALENGLLSAQDAAKAKAECDRRFQAQLQALIESDLLALEPSARAAAQSARRQAFEKRSSYAKAGRGKDLSWAGLALAGLSLLRWRQHQGGG